MKYIFKTTLTYFAFLFVLSYHLAVVAAPKKNTSQKQAELSLSAEQLYQKGLDHYQGNNRATKSFELAFYYYQLAAQKGYAKGLYSLGDLYEYGEGTQKSLVDAYHCYKESAELGYSAAYYELGRCYYYGLGTLSSLDSAIYYLQKAADHEIAPAYFLLGRISENSRVDKGERALELYKKGASLNNSLCQWETGFCYWTGIGTPIDYAKSFEYFTMCAEQNYGPGYCSLGVLYELGAHVTQSYEKALHYYQLAAGRKNPEGISKIGYFYEKGYVLPQSYELAIEQYQKAAEINSSSAQYRLGRMHLLGLGVKSSLEKAAYWFEKAGKQNYHVIIEDFLTSNKTSRSIQSSQSHPKGSREYYEQKIELLPINEATKEEIRQKVPSTKDTHSHAIRDKEWLDQLLKIPFGKYISMPVTKTDDQATRVAYFRQVRASLNKAVYGHLEAKERIIQVLGQWLSNPDSHGECLAIQGPPGNGKTSLAKEGIAKALNRPFVYISLGGARDSYMLSGSPKVYIHSGCGRIVQELMKVNCMNPIIYFDELDKVSRTEHGREIINVLMHLIDPVQNDKFEDHHFPGIELDLSKALFVFSFNDEHIIDPILKDRMQVIRTYGFSRKDKFVIAREYLLPALFKEVGLENDSVIIDDQVLRSIVTHYAYEPGVRKLREGLITILRSFNLRHLMEESFSFPHHLTQEETNLFLNQYTMPEQKTHQMPQVGLINGLGYSFEGSGSLIPIQVSKKFSEIPLAITATGNFGKSSQESFQVALTAAWNLLPTQKQQTYSKEGHGFHIHSTEHYVQKDGSSAGLAISLAFYSLFMNVPIKNDVAVTGEIDLYGNVLKVGGIYEKILGAKQAGIKTVLIPEQNKGDLEWIKENEPELLDETIEIFLVSHYKEAISYVMKHSESLR